MGLLLLTFDDLCLRALISSLRQKAGHEGGEKVDDRESENEEEEGHREES